MNKKILAEFLGSMFLLMIVVGSGIMGENLSNGNDAITLLANSIATGAGLFVLIQNIGPISGAHFNPVVSLSEFLWKRLTMKDMVFYWMAQILGAILGVIFSHFLFNLNLLQISEKSRLGSHFLASEVLATFGLIMTIALAGKKNVEFAPLTIALYITSAYWFTSSTSFANPAVTIARTFTDTFSGIAPNSVTPFIAAQFVGMFLAIMLMKFKFKGDV